MTKRQPSSILAEKPPASGSRGVDQGATDGIQPAHAVAGQSYALTWSAKRCGAVPSQPLAEDEAERASILSPDARSGALGILAKRRPASRRKCADLGLDSAWRWRSGRWGSR